MTEVKHENVYKVDRVLLLESSFKREPIIENNQVPKNHIHIETQINPDNPNGKIVVNLFATLTSMLNDRKIYEVKVVMTGVFEKDGTPALDEERFKKINAPAIIYPFIREHIASTCLKAGLGSVMVPTVNFTL